jgi:methyltransferase family protein
VERSNRQRAISAVRRFRRRQIHRLNYDRARCLRNAIHRLRTRRSGGLFWPFVWTDAIYGFGNEGWSCEENYAAVCAAEAELATRPILECGSGVSTLLLAAVAERTGNVVHSLESAPEWVDRVSSELARHCLNCATVHHAPLVPFGEYEWYDVPGLDLPADIGLVICDGPPSKTTLGHRYGLYPQMRSRLAPGCVLLSDDTLREADRAVVERWGVESGCVPEFATATRGYARLRLGERAPVPPAPSVS